MNKDVHRELLRLAVPTIVSTLAAPMLGVVDTMALGRLPDVDQLGAAAATSAIFNAIFLVFGFLRMGTTGLIAQAWGRNDRRGAVLALFQGLLLGAGIGAGLIVLQPLIGWAGFAAMGASPRVTELGGAYFSIRIFEAPAFLMLLALFGYMRGEGNALWPMYIQIGINVVNLALDLLLVPGTWGLPAMGIRGAAWASLVAHTSGWLAALALTWRRVRDAWDWTWLRRLRTLPWRRFLNLQTDLFIRTMILVLTLAAVTSFVARMEISEELAAHAILLQLWSLVSAGVDGFAFATETTVGMWLGRANLQRAMASAFVALAWGIGAGLLFGAAYVVGIDGIARFFTANAGVQAIVKDLVWPISISQPINAAAYVLDGIMIGATDTRYLRNAMAWSSLAFFALIAVWQWTIGLTLASVWWSVTVFMVMRTVTLALRFRGDAWHQTALAEAKRR